MYRTHRRDEGPLFGGNVPDFDDHYAGASWPRDKETTHRWSASGGDVDTLCDYDVSETTTTEDDIFGPDPDAVTDEEEEDMREHLRIMRSIDPSSVDYVPDAPDVDHCVLRIGDTCLVVHRNGKVGSGGIGTSFHGPMRLVGTPYTYVRVFEYGVEYHIPTHEIVWTAFRGKIPSGQCVRHADVTLKDEDPRIVSNALSNLVCVPEDSILSSVRLRQVRRC